MAFTTKREMTITHNDFFRILPKALGGDDYLREGNCITCRRPTYSIRILVSDERRWQIAGLELPTTDIELIIEGCSDDKAQLILRRFEQSFQKGGG